MKAEVADLGQCKRRLTVEVEVEKVKKQYEEVCVELRRSMELPGFRKGRVPRDLLVGKFGKQISSDVKAKLLNESFKDAVKEKDLEPVSEPDVDLEKVEFDLDKPLKYECEVEVKPQFAAPECEGLELGRPPETVSDAEVCESVDRIRRRLAEVHPVAEPARTEDFLSLDVRLLIDGKEAWKDGDLAVALAEDRVLGLPFELDPAKLVGAAAGAKVSAEVELPMNFRVAEYRGKTAAAELEVKEVKRPKLPELDEAFAKRIGEESVEAFRAKVREGLASEKKLDADNEVRRQIVDKLVAATSFELPEKLLARTADRDELRRRYHLQRLGLAGDAMGEEAREELHNVSRQQAERDLRAFLIIEKVAKAKGLDPTDAEVDEHFAGLAARRGADPAALKAHAEEHGEIEVVRSDLRERKVMEFIISKATITEKAPEPEAEEEAGADGGKKPAKAHKPAAKKKPAAKAKPKTKDKDEK